MVSIKAIFFILFFALISWCLIAPDLVSAKKVHQVHFSNTPYELNVYKIFGKKPGKTLMLIGGIQGNEPGGFLSADLYADMSLEQGNLIVVPRANFYSILLNRRGPHGDMNRKFTSENLYDTMEDKIVSILKGLISKSDYLLNLHDGSGYYFPEYVDKWRNPTRFGQSIIADCDIYKIPGTGKILNLGEMARKVIHDVNAEIENKLYKFHFNNTRTDFQDSIHKEQRLSATYYALVKHNIPAFGVETSKFLPTIDLKVRYHNLVINAFMKLFGIIPETPRIALDPPKLKYLVASINGQIPIVFKAKQAIKLREGDTISVSHVEANYERGLSVDILGYGSLNDYHKDFAIYRNTTLIVRKDNHKFAEIPVRISGKRANERESTDRPGKIDSFIIEAKGHRLIVKNGETLDLVKGDKLRIVGILPEYLDTREIEVNFKGFVGDRKENTGEDRGYTINTGEKLIKRYSIDAKGVQYPIVASNGKILGGVLVRLNPPKADYTILKINSDLPRAIRPGDTVTVSENDELYLQGFQTNLYSDTGIYLSVNGRRLDMGEKLAAMKLLGPYSAGKKHQAYIKKDRLILGEIHIYLE